MMINRNDGVADDAPQEKLEWVTPKISLMESGESDGTKSPNGCGEGIYGFGGICFSFGQYWMGPS